MHSSCSRFLPAAIVALGILSAGTAVAAGPMTTVDFYGRRVGLPGTWQTKSDSGSVIFTRNGGSTTPITFSIKKIPSTECGYVYILRNALNAWGGDRLHSKDVRLVPIRFKTSRYTGYSWVLPGFKKGIKHWCLGQEPKVAIEMSAPMAEADLIKYIDQTLLLQYATKRGR